MNFVAILWFLIICIFYLKFIITEFIWFISIISFQSFYYCSHDKMIIWMNIIRQSLFLSLWTVDLLYSVLMNLLICDYFVFNLRHLDIGFFYLYLHRSSCFHGCWTLCYHWDYGKLEGFRTTIYKMIRIYSHN